MPSRAENAGPDSPLDRHAITRFAQSAFVDRDMGRSEPRAGDHVSDAIRRTLTLHSSRASSLLSVEGR
jgi:hypothetical protein